MGEGKLSTAEAAQKDKMEKAESDKDGAKDQLKRREGALHDKTGKAMSSERSMKSEAGSADRVRRMSQSTADLDVRKALNAKDGADEKMAAAKERMAQAQNEDAAVSAAKNAAKHASELAVKAEKKAVDKGTMAEQLKAKADSKASLSRSAALTAAELSAKAVAEAGLSAGEQGKSNTLAQEKTDAVAALKKAEADKEFATGLKKKHLRGQAAQKVEKAVDCVVDKAKKNITSVTAQLVTAQAANGAVETTLKSMSANADSAKSVAAKESQQAIQAQKS